MIARSVRGWSWVALVGLMSSASAQGPDPNYVFHVTSGSGAPTSIVELQVLADNTGDNVDGWAFGVCTDPSEVIVSYVEPGEVVVNLNNGNGPFFYAVNMTLEGWTVGVVVN